MTGSWDKTVKFWDTRSPNPIMTIDMGERVYAADVDYPMAVVGMAGRGLRIYNLEGQPKLFKQIDPPLKYQHRCISIFRDKNKQNPQPTGKAPNIYPNIAEYSGLYHRFSPKQMKRIVLFAKRAKQNVLGFHFNLFLTWPNIIKILVDI